MDILRDVRRDVAEFVGSSGACPEDEIVLTQINDARRILYPLGDWKDTVVPVVINCYGGCFTLPSDYEYLKDIRKCSVKIPVHNEWFTVFDGDWDSHCGARSYARNMGGKFAVFRDWYVKRSDSTCRSCNAVPVGFFLNILHEDERDTGTQIIFHCQGQMQGHVSLTRELRGPYIQDKARPGEVAIAKINYVIKPKTYGRIRVYGYDDDREELLAIYEPHEVNPEYIRYHVGLQSQALGKAKKKYLPIDSEETPVDINTEALIHALQAINDRKAKNLMGFGANLKLATDFLNRELSGPTSTTTLPMKMSHAFQATNLIVDE